MTPKIFITGATGYIGGDALYALYQAHPEWDYTALVRNSDRGAPVAAAYPKVRLVYGNLDDSELIEAEAARADVVLHTADASDHGPSAKSIAAGLLKGHSEANPGFWLHTGGAGILCWKDMETETYGEAPTTESYDDLEGVAELTSLPDSAFHRNIDKIVIDAGLGNPEMVKTAIVCPPTIYGRGRGPVNQKSRQVNNLVRIALQRGKTPGLGKGLTEWNNVHVQDLSNLWVLLAEAASKKGSDFSDSKELWGKKGYFLAENGSHRWGDISRKVAQEAYKAGYISTAEVEALSVEGAKEAAGFEALSWGLNSKGSAGRARKYVGWKPTGKTLDEEIPGIIEDEARSLKIKPGHAKKAAGVV